MLSGFIRTIMNELRDHPLTLVMLLTLFGWAWYSDVTHAKQADMVRHLVSDTAAFTEINAQYTKLMRVTVGDAIQSSWVTWCGAKHDTRVQLNSNLNSLQAEYTALTGRDFRLPDCGEITP